MDIDTNLWLDEHRFWLQILGDHARFIFYALSPNETGEIPRAQSFIQIFDSLLATARQSGHSDISDLNSKALKFAQDFRVYKLQLLALTLSSQLKIHLSSTFFNHMINELDEYIFVMNTLNSGRTPLFYPMHYHLLWLPDAAGHAAGVGANLDEVEKDKIAACSMYEKQFTELYVKAINLNGYMRTGLKTFPAMERLNKQSVGAMIPFKEFLENTRDMRKNGMLLGTLLPLMADHMAREECYYLTKLSQSTENTSKPGCDPERLRLED